MWTLTVYRTARELVSVWQNLRDLYEMAAEFCRQRDVAHPEIELSSRFRECCGMAHEDEPLFYTEPEPHDTGWTVVSKGQE